VVNSRFKNVTFTFLLVVAIFIALKNYFNAKYESYKTHKQLKETVNEIVFYKRRRAFLLNQPLVGDINVTCKKGYSSVISYKIVDPLGLKQIGRHESYDE